MQKRKIKKKINNQRRRCSLCDQVSIKDLYYYRVCDPPLKNSERSFKRKDQKFSDQKKEKKKNWRAEVTRKVSSKA